MNKIFIAILLTVVVAGAGSFYGGMKYQQGKTPIGGQNFRNLSIEDRQLASQRSGQMVQQTEGATGVVRNGIAGNRSGGLISGEILSKDDKSITVKLPDGGSKLVFYSGSTQINKSASGTVIDLETGKTVMVNGSANSDGSISAQTIQIR